jgi:serine/threonine-protein kinase
VSEGTSIRAFLETGGFDATLARYLHARLRIAATFLACAGGVLVLASAATWMASGSNATEPFFTTARSTLVVAALVAAAFLMPLSKPDFPAARLGLVDATLTGIVLVAAAVFYATAYSYGPEFLVPVLALLIVTRAVFVPSRPLRTFILAAPAPVAVLVVALWNGTVRSLDGVELTHGAYVSHVVWDQVVLGIAVALAVFASQVNFALRLQAYKASELGQYKLIDRLGAGAMGEVWRAQHGLMRRPTAIKIIHGDVVDEKTLRRFEEEVRQTCRLSHPNVIVIYDYGRTLDGVFFYAMELLDGIDLAQAVKESGPFPPARVIHVLVQACSGLAEAHARGLVHRDVKSANLFICERGLESDVVKVVDFGLVLDVSETASPAAEIARPGELCGTPQTMAPETIRGRPPTPRVDVYALGAVGCFLLTGKQIFDTKGAMEFIRSHVTEAPIPPSVRDPRVPKDLEAALMRCLAKDPEQRTASVLALRDELLDCADAGAWTPGDAAAWWRARRGPKAEAPADVPAS